jgi:exonuclease III
VSADLVSRVRDASILDEASLRPRSDHAPISIDLAVESPKALPS